MMLRIVLSSLFCVIAQLCMAQVGIQQLKTDAYGEDLSVRVFYPTEQASVPTQFGRWTLNVARNAAPRSGRFGLIVVSHGIGGREWNHHDLATRLVQAGFVVAAVRHVDDLLRVGRLEFGALRVDALHQATGLVLESAAFAPIIERDRIGAYGFSLGGFTVLAAAGGAYAWSRVKAHCQAAENDPNFCVGEPGGAALPMWLRARRMFYAMPVRSGNVQRNWTFRAVVAAAPVGQPFTDLGGVTGDIYVIQAA